MTSNAAIGRQSNSLKPSQEGFSFGTGTRDAAKRLWISKEHGKYTQGSDPKNAGPGPIYQVKDDQVAMARPAYKVGRCGGVTMPGESTQVSGSVSAQPAPSGFTFGKGNLSPRFGAERERNSNGNQYEIGNGGVGDEYRAADPREGIPDDDVHFADVDTIMRVKYKNPSSMKFGTA